MPTPPPPRWHEIDPLPPVPEGEDWPAVDWVLVLTCLGVAVALVVLFLLVKEFLLVWSV